MSSGKTTPRPVYIRSLSIVPFWSASFRGSLSSCVVFLRFSGTSPSGQWILAGLAGPASFCWMPGSRNAWSLSPSLAAEDYCTDRYRWQVVILSSLCAHRCGGDDENRSACGRRDTPSLPSYCSPKCTHCKTCANTTAHSMGAYTRPCTRDTTKMPP